MKKDHSHNALTAGGLLVSLGIIFGDIGTSPLYVLKAIMGNEPIQEYLVYGGLSAIFWTLTLQTTTKYVVLVLRADNNGEGGIFSLYALVRRRVKWLTIPAMIGGSTLLAEGIITPPISVSSAIEGLNIINPDIPTIPITIGIISLLFLFQRFGTKVVGRFFGPVMFVWFSMLATLGIINLMKMPEILKAINPYYTYELLRLHPGGILVLGAVFLCTTGAEALYSDLGHCGRQNIRVSWIFVKTALLLNYFGQGAWILTQNTGSISGNPFYGVMPSWFLPFGISIATLAAIVASQALISGSFTLISEAIRLNFWPKLKLNFPSDLKGQLYVPALNTMLWLGCVAVVLYFKESEKMEAAYGLSVTITMLMTTMLYSNFLVMKRVKRIYVLLFLALYLAIESAFFSANLLKFMHGGFVTIIIGGLLVTIMYVWHKATEIKNRLTEYDKMTKYMGAMKELSNDTSIPKYATNLVFMTSSNSKEKLETKIAYSIFYRQPKRADIYWFVHVDTTDEPYTMEYKVDILAPEDVVWVTFRLGFRVEQRINLYFRKVVEDMVKNNEVDITSRYASLARQNVSGDFRFVVMEKYLSSENELPVFDQIIMETYFFIKQFTISEKRWFGLDTSQVTIEKVPLLIRPVGNVELTRIKSEPYY
ncbi:MAG: KUP/HAK/KT family potassium transporter [Cytophagales bacterium]